MKLLLLVAIEPNVHTNPKMFSRSEHLLNSASIVENSIRGAPYSHAELLMLEIEVAEETVSRYLGSRRRPPSQCWRTYPSNHPAGIPSIF
jgi:hypothetical protein